MLLDEWGLVQHATLIGAFWGHNLLMLCQNSPLAVGADAPLPEHIL